MWLLLVNKHVSQPFPFSGSHNSEDRDELSKFAKNYLPILFNLYTTKPHGTDEEGERLAAFETIKVMLNKSESFFIFM